MQCLKMKKCLIEPPLSTLTQIYLNCASALLQDKIKMAVLLRENSYKFEFNRRVLVQIKMFFTEKYKTEHKQ